VHDQGSFLVHFAAATVVVVTAAVLQVMGILWVWRILKVHF